SIAFMGINFDDEIRALLILCSLPKSWNGLVMAVSNFVFGSNTPKYDDVIGVILSEETCRKTSGGSTSGSALNTQRRGRMTKRGNNSRNRGKSRGKSKGRRSQSRGPNDYWYYGKPGHKKKDCWNRKKNEGDKLDGDKEANVISKKSKEDALLLSLESVDDS
ncbi:hypothetical protein P3S38_28955, partial [Enterobacter hormaechei]|uniref:hypothetical protein n=1 Tax=Enterobacter hormaechei TaxID=158836 RepID=UPI0023E40C6F